MATADRATCNTRAHAPLIDQAVGLLVSSLFNNLVNVIFMSTCVSIKHDSVAHFLNSATIQDCIHTRIVFTGMVNNVTILTEHNKVGVVCVVPMLV